jgi:hypothetical protein
MTAAEKQAVYRARRDCGDVVLPVRVNLNACSGLLEHLGLLQAADRDDRSKIAEALARQVDILVVSYR